MEQQGKYRGIVQESEYTVSSFLAPPYPLPGLLLPRSMRLRDAPACRGMDRNRFNAEARPHLTLILIGQGIAFDHLDLDDCVDQYKSSGGRPVKKGSTGKWNATEYRGFSNTRVFSISIDKLEEEEFTKSLKKEASKRRKYSSSQGIEEICTRVRQKARHLN